MLPVFLPYRFAEVAALLPILHTSAGPATIAVLGTEAGIMAAEVLKRRDTKQVLTLAPLPGVNDRRVKVVDKFEPASCDVILLSPEQAPAAPLLTFLKPGGVIQSMTLVPENVPAQLKTMRELVGNVTPWREHLPHPIYGALACLGRPCKRLQEPPPSSKRLTTQYLPSLFTFGKDERPLVFPPVIGTIAAPS